MSRFDEAVAQFNRILQKFHQPNLTPAEAHSQFYGWMGQVQRLLSVANEELSRQLAGLRTEGVDTLAAVSEFSDYQMAMSAALDDISEILKGCNSVQALLDAESRLNECLARVEQAGDHLGALLDEDESESGPGPLPDDVADCLDHLEAAMQHMVRYSEQREHDDLLRLAALLDQARDSLGKFLQAS
ncbi:hypothetical protein JST97_34730 [bacterium]|nr:hypothetical protein [bacterium]